MDSTPAPSGKGCGSGPRKQPSGAKGFPEEAPKPKSVVLFTASITNEPPRDSRMLNLGQTPSKHVRCAIYTRKSSEEGLEQSFNSLEAQRDACRAYILSQKHEGWIALNNQYDDGGFSGGTMERP